MLSFPDPDPNDWRARLYWNTNGILHVLISAILEFEPRCKDGYVGKASITDDGWVTCDVLTFPLNILPDARVGHISEVLAFIEGTKTLIPGHEADLDQAVQGWLAIDNRILQ